MGILCAAWLLTGVGSATAADMDLSLGLAYGYDSNPSKLSDRSENGGFGQISLDAGLELRPRRRAQLFFQVSGSERMYESAHATADSTRADLLAGVAFVPVQHGSRRLAILLGGESNIRRSTFVDPRTGEIFEYKETLPDGSSTSTPIPDRFDFNSSEAFLDLRWKLNRRVRLSLETRLEHRNYVEDYDAIDDLDTLDFRSLSVEPGIRVRLGRLVTMNAFFSSASREYDEQPALDIDGSNVSGSLREYRYQGYGFSLSLEPSRALDIRFGIRATDRSDLHAGYYNSDTESAHLWLQGKMGKKNRVQLYASHLVLSYDNATVGNDPNGEIRGGDVLIALSRFERMLPRSFVLFTEVGTQRVDNQDPILAYDRHWALTGFQYRFER